MSDVPDEASGEPEKDAKRKALKIEERRNRRLSTLDHGRGVIALSSSEDEDTTTTHDFTPPSDLNFTPPEGTTSPPNEGEEDESDLYDENVVFCSENDDSPLVEHRATSQVQPAPAAAKTVPVVAKPAPAAMMSPVTKRKWKQAQASKDKAKVAVGTRKRQVSIGERGASAEKVTTYADYADHDSQEFIVDVRRGQRRATKTKLGRQIHVNLWDGGFRSIYESGKFADITLECQGREYEAHRAILSYCSNFFKKALRETKKGSHMVLEFPDPDHVFPDIMRYMYVGDLEITAEKAVPLLAMADHYLITGLKSKLSSYISVNVQRENAMTMLKKALQFHADKIVTRCIHVIANNFAYLYDVSYTFLPPPLFVKLIKHKYLSAVDEHQVFQHIKEYLRAHPQISEKMKRNLLGSVRYRWFTLDQLLDAMEDPNVPRDFLLEAVFARLEQYELPISPRMMQLSDRLKPRPLYPVYIRFVASDPFKGVIDWIGCEAGSREWDNPHATGAVVVSASSLEKGRLQDLLSKNKTELWTKSVPASWFSVDFGANRSLIPTYYSLRHGGNYSADSLRNWDFQGSKDGIVWTTLRAHRHDPSLQGPFAIASWPLPKLNKSYRYFRVIQTGHNSSGHNYLVLSNLEIHGNLYTRRVTDEDHTYMESFDGSLHNTEEDMIIDM